MKHTFHAYFIQCITNMHVGSGDANFGIVDKLVQRDPVTKLPTIHSSSLKGALREYFESIHGWGRHSPKINAIFGKEANNKQDSETGEYKFLGADLVSIPVRANFEQFVMAVNKEQLERLNQKLTFLSGKEIFNIPESENALYFKENEPTYDLYAEDVKIEEKLEYKKLINTETYLLDKKYASFDNESFINSFSKNLPVIARNSIEDGTSDNLWYEEVVPHQSIFLTFIGCTDNLKSEFEIALKDGIIQIGGNATIGYGLCKFFKAK